MSAIFWFRQDLRLTDNPGLLAAAESGDVTLVYILEDDDAGTDKMGAASRVFLHHALSNLNQAVSGHLLFMKGPADICLQQLVAATGATSIHWNRCYEPWRMKRDSQIKTALQNSGIEAHSHQASLLWEPMQIHKADGTPYKVFTPYYRRGCLAAEPPRQPLPRCQPVWAPRPAAISGLSLLSLSELELLPAQNWHDGMMQHWQASEAGAAEALQQFCEGGISHYAEGRNFPAQPYVSRLSPHLHFGTLSPQQAWYGAAASRDPHDRDLDIFHSELGWREFSYQLLYHNHQLKDQNLNQKFNSFPWLDNPQFLSAWQRGMTGYPIVDAGMRELYQTGYMHNRVRMIVGSFLVKNLLLHWHHGEAWFWDCLVDADHASNSASWQWIAGCGADAAPYFRVFNPITQGEKFDKEGHYTRRFVPELKDLPNKYLFAPWSAPEAILTQAGIRLGETYPRPIVDVKASRQAALDAFATLPKAS